MRFKHRLLLTVSLISAAGIATTLAPLLHASAAHSENAPALTVPDGLAETTANALAILDDSVNPMDTPAPMPLDTMPDEGCVRMHINPIGNLRKTLRDSNYYHYEIGKMTGIDPISCEADAWRAKRPLMRMTSCREFFVAPMTHSYPYLIPEASQLLHEIGAAFADSLRARGGGDYRIKVTSMLRTNSTVRRLRRVNRASVDSSSHQFGTTFDISYTRFMLTRTGGVYRTQEDLKNLLAEVVMDFRNRDRLYAIYEPHSGCIHITVRPPGHPPVKKPQYLIEQEKNRKNRRHRR